MQTQRNTRTNEQSSDLRKKGILRAGIIFVLVMILLTFFSKTIENFSLAQVRVETSTNGTINQQVSGEGTFAPRESGKIKAGGELIVESLKVKEGDDVLVGQVVAVLDVESLKETLLTEEIKLKKQRLTLQNKKNETSASDPSDPPEEPVDTPDDPTFGLTAPELPDYDYREYERAITKAYEAIGKAERAIPGVQADQDELVLLAQENMYEAEEAVKEAKVALEKAEKKLMDAAKNIPEEVENIEEYLEPFRAAITAAEKGVKAAEKAYTAAERAVTKAGEARVDALIAAHQAVADAKQAHQDAVDALKEKKEDDQKAYAKSVSDYEKALLKAQENFRKTYDKAYEAYLKQLDAYNKAQSEANKQKAQARKMALLDIQEMQIALDKAENDYKEMEEQLAKGGDVISKVRGRVQKINVKEGEKVAADLIMMELSDIDKGFAFTFDTTLANKNLFKLGEKVNITLTERWDERVGIVAEVKPAETQPSKMITVVCNIELPEGDKIPTTGRVDMFIQSKNYETTVPLGALRGSEGSQYILVLSEYSGLMGSGIKVEKVSVQVEATDSQRAAVSGLPYGSRMVIASDKPIEEGDKVRLMDKVKSQ